VTRYFLQFGIKATSAANTGYKLILSFTDTNGATTITGSSTLKCNTWHRTAFVGRKTKAAPDGILLEHEMLLYMFDAKTLGWKLEV
jgi:hypothetical protein